MGGTRSGERGMGANEHLTKAGDQESLWKVEGTTNRVLSISSEFFLKSHRGTKNSNYINIKS